jgi:hypothetical protein
MIACAINERQQRALEYKTEEVLVLKDVLKAVTGKERIDFTEDQRRRLAVVGKGQRQGARRTLRASETKNHPRVVSQDLLGEIRQLAVTAEEGSSAQAQRDSRSRHQDR